MSAHDETADILDRAAAIIERDGWHQGGLSPSGNVLRGEPVCALGALQRVGVSGYSVTPFYDAIRPLVAPAVEPGSWSLVRWNDAPERTKQEVLDTFRLAAKQERMKSDAEVAS